MRQPSLLLRLSLAVLLSTNVLAQQPVEIQFQTDPVLVQTGSEIVFTVLTVSQVFSMKWQFQGGVTIGQWSSGSSAINPGTQFVGRVAISANQLRITGAQLRDAGDYTVEVTPSGTTDFVVNSRSVQLRVFDEVAGLNLIVPPVAVEGRNVSLRCTWTAGTDITVQWGKGGVAIVTDARITISGDFLVINPVRRSDAGDYSCTVSNPVSAQTTTQSVTVYYGPDTPVLTKESAKECVGGGDVLVGQEVRLTCLSDSLPPALFSWQRDGQTVATGQPDSGVLNLQTLSTDESGRYVCMARNSVTGGTSEHGTDLAIVATCLNVGEVVGIVIGCLLLLILIVLIVFLLRRRRAQRQSDAAVLVQKDNPNPRLIPPDPQPNGARDLGQGPQPPLYNTRHPEGVYAAPRESRSIPQTLQLNGLHNSGPHQQNGLTHANGLLQNNANSYPHTGIDNRAFTHTDAQNTNTLPNTQQQNPNILIQTGGAQGGNQQPGVHLSLNTLPQSAQQNNNAQMPTIHVNLNSYPTNSHQTQQDSSFPLTNTANNNTLQSQQNVTHAEQSNPRMQSGQPFPSDPRLNGHIEADHLDQPRLVPTGYTHYNSNNTVQRNADTQTFQRDPEPPSRSERNSWDLLRGTPAYPSGTPHRRQTSPEYTSDNTDYTYHPPIPEASAPSRSQHRLQSQNTSRSRASPRREAPSEERRTGSRSADHRGPNTRSVTQLEAEHNTQRGRHTQRQSAQRDIRDPPGSQNAPRQEATHRNNPQALPLMSQQASVVHSALSQGPTTQQGPAAPRGADTRALADPNHLPQTHRAAQIQTSSQGLGKQTQPVINGANPPRQGGTAPLPNSSAQHNPSHLTQAALTAHTERAQTFQNRKHQTMAALLHPGPQTRAPADGAKQPPAPPPVIPLTQFQTLPKKHIPHRSPVRGPQPPRPPVNMPVAQRHQQVQHRPTNHHPQRGHMHADPHRHANGHGHPAHFTQQHQTHRGRPK
ncbi:hypothetical protein PBY51_017416 [Eleginops maclovinus]|uniref:Ig-like domain-containing protein n=1 Tax=Eleginops maclovinus TaxID=56733 RepID=A0AAN7XJM4_ELEMC|nr:hypothetical protein PBY51_017416 [Eleginops maclovinus]